MKILKAIFVILSEIAWLIAMVLIFVVGIVLDTMYFMTTQIYWALIKATRFVVDDWSTKLLAYIYDEPLEKIREEWKEP